MIVSLYALNGRIEGFWGREKGDIASDWVNFISRFKAIPNERKFQKIEGCHWLKWK
jgi:hypothetical protein